MAEIHELGRLAGGQDRMTLLQQLVDQMSFDERCAVSAMISKRNDPLAVLPMELIIEILNHLPIFVPWQLQLVSRRWRSLLSSETILRASITRWDTHSVSDSARDPLRAEKDSVRTKVRHMQAMRLGCPFTAATFPQGPNPRAVSTEHAVSLRGSRVAYISASKSITHYSVVVVDFLTGNHMEFQGDAREQINLVALGPDFVAFSTYSAKLYVKDLTETTRPSQSVRLPSIPQDMYVDGNTVGLLVNRGIPVSGGTSVALFNTQTGSLRSFHIKLDPGIDNSISGYGSERYLLINSRAGTVDVLSHTLAAHPNGTSTTNYSAQFKADIDLQHARYSFDGQQISTNRLQAQRHWLPLGHVQEGSSYCRPYAAGYAGLFTLGNRLLCESTHGSYSDASHLYQMTFDSRTGELGRRFGTGDVDGDGTGDVDGDGTVDVDGDEESVNRHLGINVTAWKDVRFCLQNEENVDTVYLTSQTQTDAGPSRFRTKLEFPQKETSTPRSEENIRYCPNVEINDTFLVAVPCVFPDTGVAHQLFVFCFDETLECPGFTSTGIWDPDNGYLRTEKGEHLIPYPEAELR